jgi:hypothetical protein
MVRVRFGAQAQVSAPTSGVRLGTGAGPGQDGPLLLRLFRVSGTRVVSVGRPLAAQLIAIRAAAAGTPVQVITGRPEFWAPLLRHDTATHLVTRAEVRQMPGGPTLIIDDRQTETSGLADVAPWQCRIDIRPTWQPPELRAFARTDLTLFGVTAEDATPRIALAFAIPVHAVHGLARLDSTSFGILRRGRIEYVTVDPTEAEGRALDEASGYGPVTPVSSGARTSRH